MYYFYMSLLTLTMVVKNVFLWILENKTTQKVNSSILKCVCVYFLPRHGLLEKRDLCNLICSDFANCKCHRSFHTIFYRTNIKP